MGEDFPEDKNDAADQNPAQIPLLLVGHFPVKTGQLVHNNRPFQYLFTSLGHMLHPAGEDRPDMVVSQVVDRRPAVPAGADEVGVL